MIQAFLKWLANRAPGGSKIAAQSPLKVGQVFTAGGHPSVTYVSRDHLKLEAQLQQAMADGHTFNAVTGPTKSGKTVLVEKVLQGRAHVWVDGGLVPSLDALWDQLAYSLNIPDTAALSRSRTNTSAIANEAGFGVPAVAQAKTTNSHTFADQRTAQLTYQNVKSLAVIDHMISESVVLVIDDFHYLDVSVQRSFLRAFKGGVHRGLIVFLLAVPHRAFDPIQVENEVEGRFRHIQIPSWSINDLILIPKNGFEALSIETSKSLQRRICEDSFGNPLLVQEICLSLCTENEIYSRQEVPFQLGNTKLLETYRDVAESKAHPTFKLLSQGPEKVRARRVITLRGGEEVNLYRAIMLAVARLGPKRETSYREIKLGLNELIAKGEKAPLKKEIVSALVAMNGVARSREEGAPPIEWVAADEQFVIIDPFLMFYMRWTFRDQEAPAPGVKLAVEGMAEQSRARPARKPS